MKTKGLAVLTVLWILTGSIEGSWAQNSSGQFSSSLSPLSFETQKSIESAATERSFTQVISNDCENVGDELQGETTCIRKYSDGSSLTVINDYETQGNEYKQQVKFFEKNAFGNLTQNKTVRKKITHSPKGDKKLEERFDIVKRPPGEKITREFVTYQYHPEKGYLERATWTRYSQIEDKMFASIDYFVVLRFNPDGSPQRVLAEKWENGKMADPLISWDLEQNGPDTLDWAAWKKWAGFIYSASFMETSL